MPAAEIGDWTYAAEARYLQGRLAQWRTDLDDPQMLIRFVSSVATLESLERLLRAYVDAHTVPKGQSARSLFQTQAALGLGYAISIVIERWEHTEDYPFRQSHHRRPSRRQLGA